MYRYCVLLGLLLGLIYPISTLGKTRFGENLCDQKAYFCIKISRGETWEKLFPDPMQRDLVQRINRMNIPLRTGMTLAIPHRLGALEHLSFSPFPKSISAPNEKLLIFDPDQLAFAAYNAEGEQIFWGAASGGRGWCPDIGKPCVTEPGEFRIYHRRGAECVSSQFPINKAEPRAKIPYCLFFNGGIAFHGSDTVPGYNDSHGCVRLFPRDAKWLHDDFIDFPQKRTKVIIRPSEDL